MTASPFLLSYVALWILVSLLFVAVFLLYRHFGQQLIESEKRRDASGPPAGRAWQIEFECIDGSKHRIGHGRDRPNVVVFTAIDCKPCEQVKGPLSMVAASNDDVDVVLVHRGDRSSAREFLQGFPPHVVAISDASSLLFREWTIPGTPFFIATDQGGIVKRKGTAGPTEDGVRVFFDAVRE